MSKANKAVFFFVCLFFILVLNNKMTESHDKLTKWKGKGDQSAGAGNVNADIMNLPANKMWVAVWHLTEAGKIAFTAHMHVQTHY